jgi:hypothetical protein
MADAEELAASRFSSSAAGVEGAIEGVVADELAEGVFVVVDEVEDVDEEVLGSSMDMRQSFSADMLLCVVLYLRSW